LVRRRALRGSGKPTSPDRRGFAPFARALRGRRATGSILEGICPVHGVASSFLGTPRCVVPITIPSPNGSGQSCRNEMSERSAPC